MRNQFGEKSINIHKEVVEIDEDLVMVGFGGSLPAFNEKNEKRWKGYPFGSEEEFEKEFKEVKINIIYLG